MLDRFAHSWGKMPESPLCYESLEFLASERSFIVFHPSFPGTGVRGPPRAIAPQSLSLGVTLSSSEVPSARQLGLPRHPAVSDPPVLSPAGDKRTQFLTSWRLQWIVGNAHSMAGCLQNSASQVLCAPQNTIVMRSHVRFSLIQINTTLCYYKQLWFRKHFDLLE